MPAGTVTVASPTRSEPAPKPDDDHGEAEVTGTVTGKSGSLSCPAITFKVGATPVVTSGSTKFEDTTCATLANGDTVEVKGTKASSGTVSATRVEKKK